MRVKKLIKNSQKIITSTFQCEHYVMENNE